MRATASRVSCRIVAAAAGQLGQIRTIVAINLSLGLITSVIGASGRYWG